MKLSTEKIANVLNFWRKAFLAMSTKYPIRNSGHRKEFSWAMFMCIMGRLPGQIEMRMNWSLEGDRFRLASSLVSPSTSYYTQLFATGDAKGSIRIWDINDFQKSPIFRSKKTIRGTGTEHLDMLATLPDRGRSSVSRRSPSPDNSDILS